MDKETRAENKEKRVKEEGKTYEIFVPSSWAKILLSTNPGI
jgi:hypothetical protein